MSSRTSYNLLAGLCILAATTIQLAGNGPADDNLAIILVALAGTIAGRGNKKDAA